MNVHDIRVLAGGLIHLTLEGDLFSAAKPTPGQFVEVAVEKAHVLLNRPFSIFYASEESLELLIKPLGRASEAIERYKPGDTIRVIGPLGNGFPVPTENERILMIGGGIGIAPMRYYAQQAISAGAEVEILFGNQTKADGKLVEQLAQLCPVHICTDDGTEGHKGFVTSHPALTEKNWDRIAVCGPTPMMKAVAKVARERALECLVSLENTMACGLGACLCCVEPTTAGNKCVCTEGPVFNINELTW